MKKNIGKRILAMALSLVLVLGMLPELAVTAKAATPMETKTATGLDYTVVVNGDYYVTDANGTQTLAGTLDEYTPSVELTWDYTNFKRILALKLVFELTVPANSGSSATQPVSGTYYVDLSACAATDCTQTKSGVIEGTYVLKDDFKNPTNSWTRDLRADLKLTVTYTPTATAHTYCNDPTDSTNYLTLASATCMKPGQARVTCTNDLCKVYQEIAIPINANAHTMVCVPGANETHYSQCSNTDTSGNQCTHRTDSVGCTAGSATCGQQPTCTDCSQPVGDVKQHLPVSYSVNQTNNTIQTTCISCNNVFSIGFSECQESYIYNGQPQQHLQVVTPDDPNFSFPQDTVISLKYSSDTTNVGTVTATIEATNLLTGFTSDITPIKETLSITKTYEIKPAQLTVTAEGYTGTYDGNAHGITVTATDSFGNRVDVKYGTKDGTYNLNASPTITKASDSPLTVYYQISKANHETVTASRQVIINRATPTADHFDVTWPPNAVYDGTTAYSASVDVKDGVEGMGNVTVKYNGSTEVPKDAGTYEVAVDVAEGDNYEAAQNILVGSFKVAQIDGSASVSIEGWTYGDTASTPVPTSSTNGTDNVTYQYKVKGADDSTYTDTVPTQFGDYTVKATFAATNNYNATEATADFSISKRPITVTAKDKSMTYGETAPELTWTITSGTMAGSDTLDIQISRAAGDAVDTYPITVSQLDGANPNYDITFVNGTFTINPIVPTVSVTFAEDLTYTGEPLALITSGTTDGGTLYYKVNDGEWTTTIPTATNADDYTVYYKVVGNEIYSDVAEQSVTVTIGKATAAEILWPTASSLNYGQKLSESELISTDANGTFAWKDGATIPTVLNSGYIVVYTPKDSTNIDYSNVALEQAIQITVNPVTAVVATAPTANDLTYDGTAKALIVAGETNDGTLQYKLNNGEWSTELPKATDARTYTVWYKVVGDENHLDTEPASVPVEIKQRSVTVTAEDKSMTYGDAAPELTWKITSGSVVTGEELAITIDRADGEGAGRYTITVGQTEGANKNYDITFVDGTFTINKAALTVTAENKTVTYGDAAPQYTVTASGFKGSDTLETLGGTLAFTCGYAQFDDKGTYAITPSGYESGNYEISYNSGTLTVNPKAITVTIADKTSVYGEAVAELTATDNGIVNSDTGVYSLSTIATSASDVGEYAITGTALDSNYTITFVDGSYTITEAPAACIAPTAVSGLVYDKSEQTLITAGSTNDGTLVYSLAKEGTYTENLPKAETAGTYNVWYKVIGDGNHTDSEPKSVEVKIAKADPGIGAVTAGVVENTLETGAIVLTRANTAIPGTLTVDAEQTLALGDNDIAYTFTPKDGTNYKVVTGTVTVTVVDTIAPTGTVTISTSNWKEFLNKITFELFFKETQTVTVDASDNFSGVDKIEYIESAAEMDLNAVKAASGWTEMKNGCVSVTLEDAKQFVYYIRITDKSGNVAYLSSNGVVYDTTPPQIDGVANGVTYYTTQAVTVTDKNIDTITLNGEPATGSITLEGNKEATYTIVATDKAGNSTTVTVKMAPIDHITDAMDGKTDANVTSDDQATLENIVDTVTELLTDGDLTDAETAELEKTKADAEALIEVIEDTAAAQEEAADKAAEFEADSVNSSDKAELEELAADIETLLDGNNLTQDERAALEALLGQVNDMIDAIEETAEDSKAATDTVAGYDPDTVKSTDKPAIEEALETIEGLLDGDHLTDDECEALEDAKADAEELLKAIEDAAKAADTENTSKVEDVTAGNVTPEDKSDLEKAKEDLEKALENNGGNYTDEEKEAIEDEIQRIKDALEIIENVEAVEDAISDLPATVEPDNEETVAKIEDAKKAYDELTDYEKSLINEKAKEKLDSLTAAAVAYKIVKGDGSKWTKGSGKTLSFTANGPLSKFSGIEIDGKVIDAKYYEVKAGSTIVTLKASYLETLSVGKHTITVVYTDGETGGTDYFRIYNSGSNPITGDTGDMMLYGGIMLTSLLCMAMMVMFISRKKGKYQR